MFRHLFHRLFHHGRHMVLALALVGVMGGTASACPNGFFLSDGTFVQVQSQTAVVANVPSVCSNVAFASIPVASTYVASAFVPSFSSFAFFDAGPRFFNHSFSSFAFDNAVQVNARGVQVNAVGASRISVRHGLFGGKVVRIR